MGTLHGCVPGLPYAWQGTSSFGPYYPNFALGQWDGVPCGADGTLSLRADIYEDPSVGNVLAAGMRGTATFYAWQVCGECELSVTRTARVQIPKR
jgi:hypothetical protein